MDRRAKRSVVAGGIAALAIAAATTAYTLTHSHSGHAAGEVYGTFGSFGVPSGSTPKEVLARLGPPDRKRGGCWIYGVSGHTFHGVKILPQIAGIDAVRYCFYGGVVSIVEDHWRKVNGLDPFGEPWVGPMSFGCGGKPCQNTV